MRQLRLLGIWLEQQMPRRPLRRFMRSSSISSIGPAALPEGDDEDALVRGEIDDAGPLPSGMSRLSVWPSKRRRRSKADGDVAGLECAR